MKRKLPDNLKYLKNNIKSFVEENEDLLGAPFKQIQNHKSRKKARKEERKLKKMRMDAFKRKTKMPTIESLQKDKEVLEEIKMKRKKKLDKLRQKRIRRKVRKELQQQEEAVRKKDLDMANRNDNRVLKELEKKLGMKKKKNGTLPASFQRDNMDYVLNYMEEAQGARTMIEGSCESKLNAKSDGESCNSGDEMNTNSDEEMTVSDEGQFSNDEEGSITSSESFDDKNNDRINDDGSYDDDDAINDDSEDQFNEDDQLSTVEDRSLPHSILNDNCIKKDNRGKKVKQSINVDNEEMQSLGVNKKNDKSVNVDERHKKNLEGDISRNSKVDCMVNGNKIGEDLKEDIYGRLRDTQGNVVSSKIYQPPAKRKVNDDTLPDIQVVNKQIHALINRLTETNMSHYIKELTTLFADHSRAVVTETLSNEILKSVLVHTVLPATSLSNISFLISVLHSTVGVEVSSTFLQLLTSSLLQLLKIKITEQENIMTTIDCEELDDQTSSKIKNALAIFVKLYSFKVIESTLVLEFMNHLLRLSIRDIISLDFMFKEIGFDLRKEDIISFKDLYSKLIKSEVEVEKGGGKKSIIYKNLMDTLRIIKNNQKHKLVGFDEESVVRRNKDLKIFTKGNQAPAIHVTLKDLAHSDEMGKWWLVGSAWAGRLNEDSKNMATMSKNEHEEMLMRFEKKLLEKARRHHMNTSIKKVIFCTIMTSTDYRDAFERLLRLKLTSEQQRDILRVNINLVIKESPYNPFYAHLAQQFCAYHRKYLMACKFSIWDQLKTIDTLSEKQLDNFSSYILRLILHGSLQLPVLKVIEFAEIEKPMVNFLRKFLVDYFSSADLTDETIATTFSYIASSAKLINFKSGLALFMRQFVLKGGGSSGGGGPTVVEKVGRAIRSLEAHSASDVLPSNWTSLD